ncbi:O-antigen translocase [Psychroserpens sp. SPM9]|uniref:O-antigen translocase n=1 Tax=Psychroserpens sp. SPM9 TaxID=2975598 RepID=UPI0021A5B79F|nr:O-antigen translocase [Psychroserpens sp. SPM9]MDG5492652.1 O-antigen translocase [Psychroserpens sp. SPM9]
MSLIKTSLYSVVSTSVSLVTKLITNKITAVYLGTNGIFILGQLKDFLNIGKVASNLGTDNGVVKYVAEYETTETLEPFIGSALKIHLIFSVIVCLLTLLFSEPISMYLFNNAEYSKGIVLVAFSFIALAIHSFIMSVLNGLKKIETYVLINIIATIITAIIMVLMVIKYEVIGAIYAMAFNQIVAFIISFYFIRNKKQFTLTLLKSKLDALHFKNLTKFSVMAIVAPICLFGATFFIRTFLNSNLGVDYAGSWEGMWRISAIYLMFITTTFQFYLIPTFSNIAGNKLKKEVFKVWSLSFPSIIIITFVIYLLKDFFIPLLFSKEFFLINNIILFHLLGDTVKINSWVLGKILVSKAKTKVFVFFQIGWAIVFCSLTILFVNIYGFVGVSIAYFLTYVFHFMAMNLYFRKLLWIKS